MAVPPEEMTPWYLVRRGVLLWWGVLVALVVAVMLARELRSLLIQLILALFLSFAFEPTVDRLELRGVNRGLATLGVMLATILGLVVFLAVMGAVVVEQLQDLVAELPTYLTDGVRWAESRFGFELDLDAAIQDADLEQRLTDFAPAVLDNAVGVSVVVATGIFQTITVLLFVYYFTADGPKMRRGICSVLPPRRQTEVLRIWELAITKTGAYISSRSILALISAIVHGTAFALIGLPSSIALGLWVGVISQFIPAVGVFIAGLLPILIGLGVDPILAVWVLVITTVYQQIENYLIQPRITAQTLDIHPATAIGVVLAGTVLAGPVGALLSLPFVATGQAVASAYVERHQLVDSPLMGRRPTTGLPADDLPLDDARTRSGGSPDGVEQADGGDGWDPV